MWSLKGTTESSKALEVSLSQFWGRRQRPPRSWCSGWSAPSASGRTRWAPGERKCVKTLPNQFISGAHQEDQTFRAGRREEEEGTDDPVLTSLTCPCPSVKARSYHMWCHDTIVKWLHKSTLWWQLSDDTSCQTLNQTLVSDQSLAQERDGQVQEPHRSQPGAFVVLSLENFFMNVFQTRKNHRGGIKKPSTRRHMSMKGKPFYFIGDHNFYLFCFRLWPQVPEEPEVCQEAQPEHAPEGEEGCFCLNQDFLINIMWSRHLTACCSNFWLWNWNKSLVPRSLFEPRAISDVLANITNWTSGWMKRLFGRLGALATR